MADFSYERMVILIVDDDVETRNVIKNYLIMYGFANFIVDRLMVERDRDIHHQNDHVLILFHIELPQPSPEKSAQEDPRFRRRT